MMGKIRNFIIWSLVFIGLLLAFDLLMVRSRSLPSGLQGLQQFYVEFRSRVLGLAIHQAPGSIERVIERADKPAAQQAAGNTAAPQRYVYADSQGELHFADSLDEVPVAYRKDAQPLKD